MTDGMKRTRVGLGERAPARRDPRAEPETVPPPGEKEGEGTSDAARATTDPEVQPGHHDEVRGDGPRVAITQPEVARAKYAPITRPEAMPKTSREGATAADRQSASSFEAAAPVRDSAMTRTASDLTPQPADAAGASGVAVLRRQLAALQMQLADTQRSLATEQTERAEDADRLEQMLERVATSDERIRNAEERAEDLDTRAKAAAMEADERAHAMDARIAELGKDLEKEREFVQQLRVSVQQKYEDSEALQARLTETEGKLTREREDADAQLRTLAAQLGTAGDELSETKKSLDEARAAADAARADVAGKTAALEMTTKERDTQVEEIGKLNSQLKNANMKAYAANKQLESWKIETQRASEQLREEHEASVAKARADHERATEEAKQTSEARVAELTKSIEELNASMSAMRGEKDVLTGRVGTLERELAEGEKRAGAMRKQIEASYEMLTLATRSLESLDKSERDMAALRESAQKSRRSIIEQAAAVRKTLRQASAANPEPERHDSAATLEVREIDVRPEDLIDLDEGKKG